MAPAVFVAGITVVFEEITALDVNTDIAADLQAGFGARHVVVTRAVHVADAYVFHWLWLSDNDCVGRTSARNCDQRRSGAEKQALNVHFLTSSQKLKTGLGFCLLKDSVPCPIPKSKKTRSLAAFSCPTLPIHSEGSTAIFPGDQCCERYG